ncbi:plasmid replication initiation protein, partial [Acinetobacter baylyi]
MEKLEKTERSKEEKKERPRRCRFAIGSAPLTSIAETDAQISGGETRQDYKDTR